MKWYIWGEKRYPIVLCHGGYGSWNHWIHNVLPLSAHFTVIAADLPGFGRSALPPDPTSILDMSGIAAAGLREIVEPGRTYSAVGFSYGASFAGCMTMHDRARIDRLILVGPGGLNAPKAPMAPLLSASRATSERERMEVYRENLGILMLADDTLIDTMVLNMQSDNVERTRIDSRAISNANKLLECIMETKPAVTGVWGEYDARAKGLIRERMEILKAIDPQARCRVVASAGHWVQFEAAKTFNDIIIEEAGQSQ